MNLFLPSEEFTFQCRSGSRHPAGALCRSWGGGWAEVCVACPRSDRPLVGQAASCGTTLPETLDGPSLNPPAAGHGALRQRQEETAESQKCEGKARWEGERNEKEHGDINTRRRSKCWSAWREKSCHKRSRGGKGIGGEKVHTEIKKNKTNIPFSMYLPSSELSWHISLWWKHTAITGSTSSRMRHCATWGGPEDFWRHRWSNIQTAQPAPQGFVTERSFQWQLRPSEHSDASQGLHLQCCTSNRRVTGGTWKPAWAHPDFRSLDIIWISQGSSPLVIVASPLTSALAN